MLAATVIIRSSHSQTSNYLAFHSVFSAEAAVRGRGNDTPK